VALEQIPLSSDPTYSQFTELSGRDYRLDLDFVERAGLIVLNIALDDDTRLISGISLVPGSFLLQGFESEDRPPGDLIVIAEGDSVTLDDIETERAQLFYATDEELDELRAIVPGA
jgi:hypothetical protein